MSKERCVHQSLDGSFRVLCGGVVRYVWLVFDRLVVFALFNGHTTEWFVLMMSRAGVEVDVVFCFFSSVTRPNPSFHLLAPPSIPYLFMPLFHPTFYLSALSSCTCFYIYQSGCAGFFEFSCN